MQPLQTKTMKLLIQALVLSLLTSCSLVTSRTINKPEFTKPAVSKTPLKTELNNLPEIDGEIVYIGVNNFKDLTGKRKSSDTVASFSAVVTQGGEAWLMESLMESGWFKVLERAESESVLRERALVTQSRNSFDEKPIPLDPLRYAGILAFGGILDYETNNISGGIGASYLGIGASEEYRQDTVTVSLRFVSTSTGEVLVTTTATKTVISTSTNATLFRFVDLDTIPAEAEMGIVRNELVSKAVRSAIDKALIDLIYKGKEKGYWKFKK